MLAMSRCQVSLQDLFVSCCSLKRVIILTLVLVLFLPVNKLLGRIVTPDVVIAGAKNAEDVASLVHEQTYGIASDPLAATAILFSALIHDGTSGILFPCFEI